MIRVDRNPDGTPDDIVVTDPTHVHIEDMGSHWWLRIETAHGAALVVNLHPTVSVPKQLPPWIKIGEPWLRVKAAKLLRWMKGRVGISVLAETEAPAKRPEPTDRAQIAALGAQPAPLPATGDVWQELIDAEADPLLRELYIERRALGVARYDTPLQRGNGRDNARDLREELLDAMVYAQADQWPQAVGLLRQLLRAALARQAALQGIQIREPR